MTRGAIRAERRLRSRSRKRRRRIVLLSAGGIVAFAFIASLLVPGGLRARNTIGQTAVSTINTGGPVELQPDQGLLHVTPGQPFDDYVTRPATSGSHWITPPGETVPAGAPARWGFYDQELPDEVLVHNLEHGGIGLHYNCPEGCPELVQQLSDLVPTVSQYIVSPYSNMDSKIAITAYRHLMYLDQFDEDRLREFIDAYLDRAPESRRDNLF